MDSAPLCSADLERLLVHEEWLRALAWRLVGEAAADDLVQETWLAALRRPPDPSRPARPWLAGVIHRLARMRARGEGRRARRQREVARRDELPSTASMIERIDTGRRLAEAVMRLDEPYRSTLLLRYYEGHSAAEIARRQATPAGTVRWRLKRGIEQLRSDLDQEWGERRAWSLALGGLLRGGKRTLPVLRPLILSAALAVAVVLLVFLPRMLTTQDSRRLALSPTLVEGEEAEGGTQERAFVAATTGMVRSPSATRREVTLNDENGAPLADCTTIIVEASGAAAERKTDSQGRLDLEGLEGDLVAWVDRPSAFVARVALPTELTGESIVVPHGSDLRGRVMVGGEPLVGIKLLLDFDRWPYPEPIPEAAEKALGTCRHARAWTDAEGRFHFHGLAADWSGDLWIPEGFLPLSLDGVPVAARRNLHFSSADLPGRVQVAAMPLIRGRFTGMGSSLAKLPLSARLESRTGEMVRVATHTGGEGEFSFTSPVLGVERIALRVQITSPPMIVVRHCRPLGVGDSFDMGDLPLPEDVRFLELRVTDPEGRPLAGLRARGLPKGLPGNASGEDGVVSLVVPAGTREIEVGGSGWESQRLPVDATSATLRPAGRLILTVLGTDGRPCPEITLHLSASEGNALFAPGEPSPLRESPWKIRAGTDSGWEVKSDEQGRAVLEGLLPAGRLDVAALDALGRAVGTLSLFAPAAGETLERQVILDSPVGRFDAFCRDTKGRLLLGVQVVARDGEGRLVTRSGDGGRFVLKRLGPEPFELELRGRGFVPRRLPQTTLLDQGAFVLHPGRDLILRIDGAEDDELALSASHGDLFWEAERVGPGTLRLHDLPQQKVELLLTHGSESYRIEDGGRLQQRFVLPEASQPGEEEFSGRTPHRDRRR